MQSIFDTPMGVHDLTEAFGREWPAEQIVGYLLVAFAAVSRDRRRRKARRDRLRLRCGDRES
jgi:hypothetical protein